MARRMGIHYDRLDITAEGKSIKALQEKFSGLVNKVVESPSCVLPSVVNEPYLDNI